ncbi:MAG TPA: cytochrome P450 [Stellaceae bacterium]|nr:cytochrome P450 [Stellaceae bacterium]
MAAPAAVTSPAELPPLLAAPPRPARPLSTLRLLKVLPVNTLAACDEALFDEPIVERRLLACRLFVVSDPAGIRRIMQDNVENYPRLAVIRRLFRFGGGSGMLAAEGEVWRRHRRLLTPAFDHRAVLADLPAMAELAGRLNEYLASVPLGEDIDIGETFAHFVTALTARLFAPEEPAIDPVLYRLGQYPGRYSLFDFLPTPRWLHALDPGRRSRARVAEFRPLFDRLIAERRRADYEGPRDLLWRLANARDRDTGDGLSAEELRDEAFTLGATAATPLRIFPWAWYALARCPEAERRLHAELDTVLAGATPMPETLPRLVYLRRLIDETMRLYPPSPTMLRTARDDDVVCGRHIPRRSVVAILPWVVHRHRRLWEDPDHFDPDRFLPERAAGRSRYAYLPFSVGPHACIGASLAMMEITVAIAVVAQRFRLRLVPGRPIEPIGWTNLHPKGGIRATVEPR